VINMPLALKIIIGIPVVIICAKIGLRRLLYITLAFIAGFVAVSIVNGMFAHTSSYASNFMSKNVAKVLTFLILTLIPMLAITYFGRRVMVRIAILETIAPMIDSILGAGFGITLYAGFLMTL